MSMRKRFFFITLAIAVISCGMQTARAKAAITLFGTPTSTAYTTGTTVTINIPNGGQTVSVPTLVILHAFGRGNPLPLFATPTGYTLLEELPMDNSDEEDIFYDNVSAGSVLPTSTTVTLVDGGLSFGAVESMAYQGYNSVAPFDGAPQVVTSTGTGLITGDSVTTSNAKDLVGWAFAVEGSIAVSPVPSVSQGTIEAQVTRSQFSANGYMAFADTTISSAGASGSSTLTWGGSGPFLNSAITFAIAPNGDTIPPQVSITNPPNNATVSSTITISASSTDNVAVAGVQFQIDGTNLGSEITATSGATIYSTTWNTASSSDGTHVITAIAYDTSNNTSTASTTVTVDNNPPVRSNGSPSGTIPLNTTSTIISLTTDKNATCKYATSSNIAYAAMGTSFMTTGGTSQSSTVSGLVNNTSYTYYVRCEDVAGNVNTTDYPITFLVGPDTTPPSIPTGLTITGTTTSTISLSWTASTDNVGVAGYYVYRDGIQVGTSTATAFTNVGLAASTTYPYTVAAYDAAGNVSGQSTSTNATTLPISSAVVYQGEDSSVKGTETGYFHFETINGRSWFIAPDGNAFFPRAAMLLTDGTSGGTGTNFRHFDAVALQPSTTSTYKIVTNQAWDSNPGDVIQAGQTYTLKNVGDSLIFGSSIFQPNNVEFSLQTLGSGGVINWYYYSNSNTLCSGAAPCWVLINNTGKPYSADGLNGSSSYYFDTQVYWDAGPNANGFTARYTNSDIVDFWNPSVYCPATGVSCTWPTDFGKIAISSIDATPRWYIKAMVQTAFTTAPVLSQIHEAETITQTLNNKYSGVPYTPYIKWANNDIPKLVAGGITAAGTDSYRYQEALAYSGDGGITVSPSATIATNVGADLSDLIMRNVNAISPALVSSPIKNVYAGIGATFCPGYEGRTPDFYDPNYTADLTNSFKYWFGQGIWSGDGNTLPDASKEFEFDPEEADDLFGFGALYHEHMGAMVLMANPYLASDVGNGITYSDPILYSKLALQTFLEGRYSNSISALNTAWGTSYTTWGTSSGTWQAALMRMGRGQGFFMKTVSTS